MFLDKDNYSSFGLSVCVPECDAAISTQGTLQADIWQHVAGVYDGIEITIYLNGEKIITTNQNGDVINSDYLILGIWETSFNGLIDEVRIWDIVRGQEEIQKDYNKFLTGREFGLVSYWQFDEGEGQIIQDKSSLGNIGKLGIMTSIDGSDPFWVESDVPVE